MLRGSLASRCWVEHVTKNILKRSAAVVESKKQMKVPSEQQQHLSDVTGRKLFHSGENKNRSLHSFESVVEEKFDHESVQQPTRGTETPTPCQQNGLKSHDNADESTACDSASSRGSPALCERALAAYATLGKEPDVKVYNNIIHAYARRGAKGDAEAAAAILPRMLQN